jgi:GntR family transcriptional regulator
MSRPASVHPTPENHLDHERTATHIQGKDGGSLRLVVDRQLSEPYYLQLARQIRDFIAQGLLRDGDSLPSERVLAQKLQISRTAVKMCYGELKAEQSMSSHGRAGVKILAPNQITPQMGRLKGFTQEMRELGMTASTRLLERAIVQDRTIASIFGRSSTARFLKLVRLRYGDEVPMTRECAWYDLSLAPDLEDWQDHQSTYDFLSQRCGIKLAHAEQSIEAIMSSTDEQDCFGFAQPQPCLLLKRKTYTVSNQLAEYVEGTFRGDAYVYRVRLET